MAADKGAIPNSKDVNATTKEMKALNEEIERNHRLTGKATKNAGLFGDEINDLKSAMDKVVDVSKKLHLEKGYDTKSLAEVLKLHAAIIEDQKKLVELSAKLEAASATTPLDPDTLKLIVLRIKEVQAGITKFEATAKVATMKTSEGFHELADGVGSFKDNLGKAWKGNRGSMKEAGEGIKGLGEHWETMGSAMAGKKGLGAIGGIMTKLGPSIAGLGAKIAGPAGLIYSAVKGIYDMSMAMDQFVKDINKTYAMIRGPDIITPDVSKQFKQFNDMLYSTSENIRVGLDAKQITGFLEAINQAGMNIENLNTGLYGYRDAIYIASKASKTLGADLPYVASMMETMIMNLRMDLGQVDKAFVEVAFDAKKSGLSTDRFWVAVKNATASLSMYGNFITNVSKQMAKFTKTGMAGVEETANQLQELTQAVSKLSVGEKAALLQMGKSMDIVKKRAQEDVEKYTAAVKEIEKEIDINIQEKATKGKTESERSEIDKSIAKLRTDLNYNMNNLQQATKAVGADSAVAQAPYLASNADLMTQIVGKYLREALKARGINSLADLSGENLIVAQEILKAVNLGNVDVMMLSRGVSGMGTNISSSLHELKTVNKLTTKNWKLNKNDIKNSLRQTGLEGDALDTLSDLASVNDEAAFYIEELVNGNKNIETIMKDLKDKGIIDQAFEAVSKTQEQEQKKQEDMADKTFSKIVSQTLSFKEMQEIAKSEVEWRGATLGLFKFIGDGVSDIFGWLTHRGRDGFKTGAEKRAELQIRQTARNMPEFAEVEAYDPKDVGKKTGGAPDQLTKHDYENIAKKTLLGLINVDKNIKDLKKKSEGLSGKDRKIAEDQLNVLYKEKTEGEKTLESLNTIDKSIQGILDEAVLAGIKPEDLTKIMDEVKSGKHTTQEIMDKFPALTERAMQAVQRKAQPSAQGLRDPLTISKAEQPVLLHKGETILPRPDLMNTGGMRDAIIPTAKTAAAAPTRGPQGNITINVNATQRDLAMAIGNEVRSVMHSIQMGR